MNLEHVKNETCPECGARYISTVREEGMPYEKDGPILVRERIHFECGLTIFYCSGNEPINEGQCERSEAHIKTRDKVDKIIEAVHAALKAIAKKNDSIVVNFKHNYYPKNHYKNDFWGLDIEVGFSIKAD
jgi:hypothetical protein